MAEVDVFLKEEWPALGDSEILKKQLKQCRVRFAYDTPHMEMSTCKYFLLLLLQLWFSTRGDLPLLEDIYQCLETFHLLQLGVG